MQNYYHNGRSRILIKNFDGDTQKNGVMLYSLINKEGLRVDITNYGATIVRLFTPDRDGNLNDIVLGYDNLRDYLDHSPYFGAVVGRYGNRIARGQFSLDGQDYRLNTNENSGPYPCHLHGGKRGFDSVVWESGPYFEGKEPSLELTYLSQDGEEGHPGNLQVKVTYSLLENRLRVEYEASTDQATPVNLTQHSYFNLRGEGSGDILEHVMEIPANQFTPVDRSMIPTGELRPVAETPFDFRQPRAIGNRINEDNSQLKLAGGYDHNYILNREQQGLQQAARVYEPVSGRQLEVWTEEPGLQFYTGNSLDESLKGKSRRPYQKHAAFCLETQHFPDSPNKEHFPSTIVRPGEGYQTVTEFRFSAT